MTDASNLPTLADLYFRQTELLMLANRTPNHSIRFHCLSEAKAITREIRILEGRDVDAK